MSESSSAPDLVQLIGQRKMVRSFVRTPVNPRDLDQILRVGHAAPSAGNTRSLETLVLEGVDTELYWKTTLSEGARAAFPWPKLPDAPVLLIPYVNPSGYVDRYGEADKSQTGLGVGESAWSVPYWWVDGGAAVENMLLAAQALGLGACLFGQFEHETAVRERFGVPAHFRAVGTVAIGYGDEASDRPSTSSQRPRRPIDEVVHRGSWNGTVAP